MPRIARAVAVNLPHHVTQRGNYQQKIFTDNADRDTYLSYVLEAGKKYNLIILTYCLMDNHVHFIVVPCEEQAMARTFNTAHMRYSQYYNKKQGIKGHLWQGRFYSCVLDEQHLITAARYVERNPVRGKLIKYPWEWGYSSAKAHIGGEEKFLFSVKQFFDYVDFDEKRWKKYITEKDSPTDQKNIIKHAKSGRPLGSASFVLKLEKKLDRRLHPLPWGRPARTQEK